MADPFTIIAGVAGGAKILGGIMDTNSEVGQYKTQGRVARENARRASLQSGAAYSEGVRNEEQQRRGYRDFAGEQLAGAAEGSLATTGSLLDIVRQSETRANLDALKLRYEGASRGQALADESAQYTMQSQLAKKMAKRARIAGTIGTMGDIASVAGGFSGGMKGGGKTPRLSSDLGLSGATRGYA